MNFATGRPAAYIGLMSGTSMDAVDVALVETDGETIHAFGPTAEFPFAPDERALLRAAVADAAALARRGDRPGALAAAEAMTTARHAAAVARFLGDHGLRREAIAAVGFHGQTVLHRPQARLTVQIGDGPALAHALGLPVVYDFRAADMAAGGQGAPLAPVYHRALAACSSLPRPLAFVNLGGVANVTWIGPGDELIAFDTGPASALIDDWALSHLGEPMDRDGRLAARGRPDEHVLAAMLDHPFFDAPPPKSLDRYGFTGGEAAGLTPEDGAATLAAFSARALAAASRHFPSAPRLWLLSGGGARNPVLVAMIREAVGGPVALAEEAGWPGGHIEAQAFAFMTARSLRGLPISFPGTTGAPAPLTGGRTALPDGLSPSPSPPSPSWAG